MTQPTQTQPKPQPAPASATSADHTKIVAQVEKIVEAAKGTKK